MKIARIAVLAVAVGAAGGAAILAKTMLPGQQATVVETPALKTTQVLVAAKELTLGSRVKPGDLGWQDWPENGVNPSFINRSSKPGAMKDMEGTIARVPLLKGEPVNENKLVNAGEGGFMSVILGAGRRAVSLKISPESGAGGFILPNDRVDVILTRKDNASENVISETILKNVRILAIDQTVKEEEGRKVVVGKTATMELTQDQAELLSLAERRGQLSLALRSLADATPGVAAEEEDRRTGSVRMLKFGVSSQVMTSR